MKRKTHFSKLRGPGSYPVAQKNTSFNVPPKKEQHQCFSSTASRFPTDAGSNNVARNQNVGPATYDLGKDDVARSLAVNRANTAAFLAKRPENLFGIKDLPGPQDYELNQSVISRGKSWTTTVQAFGTTEKRFTASTAPTISQSMQLAPGPGTYVSERHKRMAANYVVQRVRGQLVKVKKSNKASASFKSTTGRQIEKEVSHAAKLNYPGMMSYHGANEWDTIG